MGTSKKKPLNLAKLSGAIKDKKARKFDPKEIQRKLEAVKEKKSGISPDAKKKIEARKQQEANKVKLLRLEKRAKEQSLSQKEIYKELLKINPNATIIDAMKIERGSVESAKVMGDKKALAKNVLEHKSKEEKQRGKIQKERRERRKMIAKGEKEVPAAFKFLAGELDYAQEKQMIRVKERELEKLKIQEEKAIVAKELKEIEEIKKKISEIEALKEQLKLPSEVKVITRKRKKKSPEKKAAEVELMLKYKANTIEEARQRAAEERDRHKLEKRKEFYQTKSRLKKGEAKILTGEVKAQIDYYRDAKGREVKGEVYVSPGGRKITEADPEYKNIQNSGDIIFDIRKESRKVKMQAQLTENSKTGKINTIISIENPETLNESHIKSIRKSATEKGFEIREVGKGKKKKIVIIG